MIALDTNLLVYAHRSATPEHAAAKRAIARAVADPRGVTIAVPCIGELWAVVTHPAAPPRPSTPKEASSFVQALVAAGVTLSAPAPGFGSRLLTLAERMGVSGPRVFDLQIALVAAEAGATEVWSHDRGFVAPPGMRVHDPI